MQRCGRRMVGGLVLLLLAGMPTAVRSQEAAASAPKVKITFLANDAFEKDLVLKDVRIGLARTKGGPYDVTGQTGEDGTFTTELPPGTWYATYRLQNYIPIEYSETVVREPDTTVTTTLSMNIEASGQGGARRIRIILNWGSRQDQVRDADSHIVCSCGAQGSHVSYVYMRHEGEGHSVSLDVDDRDWGGPETITLLDAPKGSHVYWVHNFSGPPATLGRSEVVVRVFFDDMAAGEFRAPESATDVVWRPFREILVDDLGAATIVPFTAEELAARLERTAPVDMQGPPGSGGAGGSSTSGLKIPTIVWWVIVLFILLWAARSKRKS